VFPGNSDAKFKFLECLCPETTNQAITGCRNYFWASLPCDEELTFPRVPLDLLQHLLDSNVESFSGREQSFAVHLLEKVDGVGTNLMVWLISANSVFVGMGHSTGLAEGSRASGGCKIR
jgi:hypothetical protein